MVRARGIVVACVFLLIPVVATAQRAELAKARALYNKRQFDDAITAAGAARNTPAVADAAAIVQARAHLERYRERADPSDLSAARAALSAIRAADLAPRDRLEFLLALGQSLFLEDDFGAAAEILESGLAAAAGDADLHDALLEWWASAIDRHAALQPREARRAAFERLGDRMSAEIAKNPGSPTAGYWTIVALRGTGNTGRAWDAAVAGWARARLMGDRAASFRGDVNRLVNDGIIPDRVRALPADLRPAAQAQMRADWELVKQKWQ
jgi:hypothetical protein